MTSYRVPGVHDSLNVWDRIVRAERRILELEKAEVERYSRILHIAAEVFRKLHDNEQAACIKRLEAQLQQACNDVSALTLQVSELKTVRWCYLFCCDVVQMQQPQEQVYTLPRMTIRSGYRTTKYG